ncbi:hypothetical protein [Paenibacillus soyae]|uniref:Spore coat protein n=1 Tax=Paenibacillus soyae TaxID=2969249 RepID=A0A9X2S9E4_9BACL|nr:hypothetical protein [Paenibacillus soyae]MCR2805369.1 hypothetical protein [Paenibacillus soyae]
MWKSVTWIGKLVAAGLIISFLSIWTTGYIVTSYVEALLKQFQLPIEVPPMAMSGVWGNLWGSDPLLVSDVEEKEELASETGDDSLAEEPASEEAFGGISEEAPITDIGGGGGSEAAGEGEPEGDRVVEEGTAGGTAEGTDGALGGVDDHGSAEGIDGTETAVTTDEIEAAKDEISEEDKAKLFEMLMTKLPQEALQQISTYVENGLTEQELTNVQQIMAQHLDESEYEQMMEILKKY